MEQGQTSSVSGRLPPEPPSVRVLRAFGADEPVHRLTGGQGTSWTARGLVFKPDGGLLQPWLANLFADTASDGFRLAEPIKSRSGVWAVEGWSATAWEQGEEPDYAAVDTWQKIIAAGRAFHEAVAHLDRPNFLDGRRDWWAQADRAAWEEHTIRFRPEFNGLTRRLRAGLGPLGLPQIVHGDLTTNVLFASSLPPLIIDVSPYWRPPAYAEGVVVADALCWHEAPAALWKTVDVPVAAVARALLFRMGTTNQRLARSPSADIMRDEAHRYARAADAIGL